MAQILVQGGTALSGSVRASGSKNAALPVLAAAMLSETPVTIRNVPQLEDVYVFRQVLESTGAGAGRTAPNDIHIDASNIESTSPPYELVNRMRASFLVLGPLVARFGEARVPLPGGCEIGARPVGEHITAMEALGAEVEQEAGHIIARAKKLKGTDVYLSIVSVGATENTLMAAALAEGTTTIHNAALEPEVIDLCDFLTACGVEIEGTGTKRITVHGTKSINAPEEYTVIPDRIEAATYLLAIAGTGGNGTVEGVDSNHFEALIPRLREMGVHFEVAENSVTIANNGGLKALEVTTAPYPGFPTDLQPQICAVLTAAIGTSTVTESIFERRMTHIPELARMGAKARVTGSSAIIEGTPGALTGVPVEATDLRCAAALVIAGLMAEGETEIRGYKHLVRGYENMPQKIAALGGKMEYTGLPSQGANAAV